jgi:hypothetical protein
LVFSAAPRVPSAVSPAMRVQMRCVFMGNLGVAGGWMEIGNAAN